MRTWGRRWPRSKCPGTTWRSAWYRPLGPAVGEAECVGHDRPVVGPEGRDRPVDSPAVRGQRPAFGAQVAGGQDAGMAEVGQGPAHPHVRGRAGRVGADLAPDLPDAGVGQVVEVVVEPPEVHLEAGAIHDARHLVSSPLRALAGPGPARSGLSGTAAWLRRP